MAGSQATLRWEDWLVTAITLTIPVVIGVVFAVRDASKMTREEYLMGGRNMAMIPVALSVFVTFQSAVSLMGIPTEIYTFGAMIFVTYVGIGLAYLVGMVTMIPLMYPLKMVSLYEYMEKRFESKLIRRLSTAIGMLQTLFYMAIVMLAPALALQSAAGIGLWVSIAVVGGIGTLYSSLGGIKSIVWTDAFQCIVIFLGIILIIIRGSMSVGNFSTAWSLAEDGGRTKLDNFSFDLRERHTWWSLTVGFFFVWMTNIYNQSTMQRVASVRSLRDARLLFGLNISLGFFYIIPLILMGLVIFAYFTYMRCDPFKGGLISNRNQVAPYFVVHALRDTPGVAGLFIASLFSAGLSTVSSGICALAANTVEDFLEPFLKGVSERTATVLTKSLVAMYGLVTVALAFAAASLDGPVTQLAASVFGGFGSPILGVFLSATCVPWVNSIGAISAVVASLSFNMWIAIGNRMYGKRSALLPAPPTDGCHAFINGTIESFSMNFSESVYKSDYYSSTSSIYIGDSNVTSFVSVENNPTTISTIGDMSSQPSSSPDSVSYFYSISYEWYSVFGTLISVFVCLLVSFLTRSKFSKKVHSKLILPCLRNFWSRCDEGETISWVKVDDVKTIKRNKCISSECKVFGGENAWEKHTLLNDDKV